MKARAPPLLLAETYMLRPCIDCGRLGKPTRCQSCSHAREALRPNFRQRGYDARFEREKAALHAALPLPCAYGCGRVLATRRDMVAAHLRDRDPMSPIIPACRSCNERAKVRSTAARA